MSDIGPFQGPSTGAVLQRYPLEHEIWDQQYSRFPTYLSHLDFIETHGSRWQEIIEFGGSNGFLQQQAHTVRIRVAPNFPVVDVQSLDHLEDDQLDAVLLDEILEHVADPWRAVREMHRILRPNGCLITSTPFLIAEHRVPEDYWRFTAGGLAELLREFSRTEIRYWGNLDAVFYILPDMMVTARSALLENAFDLTVEKRYPISLWAYAWK